MKKKPVVLLTTILSTITLSSCSLKDLGNSSFLDLIDPLYVFHEKETTPKTEKVTVKFLNEDGSEIESKEIDKGSKITAPTTNPRKSDDNEPQGGKYYSYTFSGWSIDGETLFNFDTEIKENTELKAVFEKHVVTKNVTFMVDGSQYGEVINVDKGGHITNMPQDPTKQGDEINKGYTFTGWVCEGAAFTSSTVILEDMTVTAEFSAIPKNTITVTFKVGDAQYGEVLNVAQGQLITAPTNPSLDSTEQYDYEFDCWLDAYTGESFDFTQPVGDKNIVLTAKFNEVARKYEVKFVDLDDKVISTQQIEYGKKPTMPDDLSKEVEGYTLTFLGWSKDGGVTVIKEAEEIFTNVTYYPVFDEDITTFKATIHFDYLDAPEDVLVEFNILNREEKLTEMLANLPEETIDATYEFESLPEILPLEDAIYNVVEVSKYFEVDMTSEEVDSRLVLKNRSELASLEMSDNELVATLVNDNIYIPTNYTNFELEFEAKCSEIDRFNILMGIDETKIDMPYETDNPINAINGVSTITLVPGHQVAPVRVQHGGEVHQINYSGLPATDTFKNDYVKVNLFAAGNDLEFYINNVNVGTYSISEGDLDIGKYIGIGRTSGTGTINFRSFKVKKYVPESKDFTTTFENDMLPSQLQYLKNTTKGSGEGTCEISNQVLTCGFGYQSGTTDLLVTKNKYKYFTMEMTFKLDANGGGDARINLCFGRDGKNATPNHGAGDTKGECIILVNSGQGARWYANGSTTRNDPVFNLSNVTSSFVTLTLTVTEGKYTLSNGTETVDLNTNYDNLNGYIALTTNSDRQNCKISISSMSITELK